MTESSDTADGQNLSYAPEPKHSLAYRLWHALGFKNYCHPDYEQPTGDMPGYIHTDVVTHWGWKDRLRILVSGQTLTVVLIHCDLPVRDTFSVSGVTVRMPGYDPVRPLRTYT